MSDVSDSFSNLRAWPEKVPIKRTTAHDSTADNRIDLNNQSDMSLGCEPTGMTVRDCRLVDTGNLIPSRHYTDQPYIIRTKDGAWLCVLTTGLKTEGEQGQHIIAIRSNDFGKTWFQPVDIEPPSGPEASWAVPLLAPSGRVFVFYVYNADNIRELPADDPPFAGGRTTRMDSHGQYVFRWSDDGGRTWSPRRVVIPVREFAIDRNNSTKGGVRLFWNVGRPIISKGEVFLPLHKVGGFGRGWFTSSEGAFVKSSDLLNLNGPTKAAWETLPEGETGLRAPNNGGPIAEEHCLTELSDGSFFCVYRSIDGYPVGSYSRNRGQTWETPAYLEYWDGRQLKHPRAACFAWKLNAGSFILWFHNHGGRVIAARPNWREQSYEDRNPVWMSRGTEVKTPKGLKLMWENPEIVLYDDDPNVRISYPDLCEDGSEIYLTETQKAQARVHRLSEPLVRALRAGADGFDARAIRAEAIQVSLSKGAKLPALPAFVSRAPILPYGTNNRRAGFAIEFTFAPLLPGWTGTLLESWHPANGGIVIECVQGDVIQARLSDGRSEWAWKSDAFKSTGGEHHVVINVDGGPCIITFFVDGVFSDGGEVRQFGWGRFSPYFRGLPANMAMEISAASLKTLRFYSQVLLAAEISALYREVLRPARRPETSPAAGVRRWRVGDPV